MSSETDLIVVTEAQQEQKGYFDGLSVYSVDETPNSFIPQLPHQQHAFIMELVSAIPDEIIDNVRTKSYHPSENLILFAIQPAGSYYIQNLQMIAVAIWILWTLFRRGGGLNEFTQYTLVGLVERYRQLFHALSIVYWNHQNPGVAHSESVNVFKGESTNDSITFVRRFPSLSTGHPPNP
jgi:hypothetical protein